MQLARCEYETAIEGNKIAIKLNPTLASAYCGLGDSYTYLGKYEEAVAYFEQALAMSNNDPQRWAFFTYGALACIFLGDFEKALHWADQASHIPNHQYWTYAHKSVALAKLDRLDEASEVLLQARELEPKFDLKFARKRLYYLRDETQMETYLDGLQKAGSKC